ncbi:hypothetical protein [Hoyosella altamirensis]|uniref:Tail assembly chaperone n=1 Tax=Hoyosella altamirensis TaxID=616997 RepID=A0A839RVT8_9ACTN|nr:hypothetical protein [Hoyosella altamirensis]MBB3040134.1 hypothetical protein [Hoyosella altamirensis]
MQAPDSTDDLAAKAEELDREEARLKKERAALAKKRKSAVVLEEDGTVIQPDEDEEWPHDTLEFADETWEVRKPKTQAIVMFSINSSKNAPQEVQTNATFKLLRNHMSEASYDRLTERMMDPDDAKGEFTPQMMGDLMAKIATIGTSRPIQPSRNSAK